MSDKKSKPGRIVMRESVPAYRGCLQLREGTTQRLDEAATKDLLRSGKAETFEDHEKRMNAEKKAAEMKAAAKKAPKKPAAPKPAAAKPEPKKG